MRNDDTDEREVQHAVVKVPVALEVGKEWGLNERREAIVRKLRLGEIEIRPGLIPDAVELSGTETLTEAAERRLGQAESRIEGRLDRQRERYFDNHGHF